MLGLCVWWVCIDFVVLGLLVCPCVWVCLCVSKEEEDDEGEKMPELVLQMEKKEKKGEKCEINHAYMHNFASTDVSVFLVKMCKINNFLYFA